MLKTQLDATIDWVTQEPYKKLVHCFTDVTNVLTFPRHSFWTKAIPMMRELRYEHYDLVIDFQGLFKSGFVTRMARTERRIGPSYHREGSVVTYSEIAGTRNPDRHAVEQALDVVEHLGLERTGVLFPVEFPHVEVSVGVPRVALVPCSRWPTKNWPSHHFAEVGQCLAMEGAEIFLMGSPADRQVCSELERAIPGAVNLCGKTDLVTLGGTIQAMDLVVSVDTGPMHIAAACGVPVLALFGATDAKRTGPYGSGHMVLFVDELACRPCRARVCVRKDLACLTRLAPKLVVETAKEMLVARPNHV